MAERSVLTLAKKTSKTQGSMRAKLEEWRKAKQQQTAKQLKQQTVPLKTPNRVIKSTVAQQKAKSIQAKSKACQKVNHEQNTKEIKRRHSKIQKEYLSEDPLFDSKPPETFEIVIAQDPKKARRSTFTIETPIKFVSEKSKENTKPCEKNQQNQSEKNSTQTMDPGKNKQASSAKNMQRNQRFLRKKNGPSKKVSQVPKSKVEPKGNKLVNLSRTPVKLLPPHQNKSLSTRERLELWRKEKGKAGDMKTPATLRRKSAMTSSRKDYQPINMETQEPLPLEPFDTMNCDIAEKKLMPEEIRKKLQNCLEKVQEDKTNDDMIATQLDEIQNSHPGSLQCAEFWISRAKIAEHEEDDGRVVCLYEQALVFNAEPEHLIKEAVAEYSRTREGQEEVFPVEVPDVAAPVPLPTTPMRAGQPTPFDSSIIKYSVTKATPFKSRLKSCERSIVTPVRRSARVERCSVHYPMMLQEHGLAVRHLDDLPEDIKKDVLFKPNFTVQNDLNDAWKDLWNE